MGCIDTGDNRRGEKKNRKEKRSKKMHTIRNEGLRERQCGVYVYTWKRMRKSSSQERNKSTRNELNKEKETDIPQRVHHATNATVQKHGVELLQCVDTHTHLMQKAISETGKKKKKSDVTYDEIRKKKKKHDGRSS
jgi:hypothetical protein